MSTVQVERSIVIRRSIEDVFAFATDATKWPTWVSIVEEANPSTSAAPIVGTTIRQRAKFLGKGFDTESQVTRYEQPTAFAHHSIAGPITNSFSWIFAPSPEGTTITAAVEVETAGFLSFAGPLVGTAIKKALTDDLESLKKALER